MQIKVTRHARSLQIVCNAHLKTHESARSRAGMLRLPRQEELVLQKPKHQFVPKNVIFLDAICIPRGGFTI